MASQTNVVVVGAGVIGLTSALILARTGKSNVTVVAKHMPGDYDIEYTSPWAGANWWPMADKDTKEAEAERISFHELWRLAHHVPEAGIHVQPSLAYSRSRPDGAEDKYLGPKVADPWFKDLAPEFRHLFKEELPLGNDEGIFYKSVCINTQVYLPYLVSCCLKLGVTFRRAILEHICDAVKLHASGNEAEIVVNCTGLLARKLGGVMDQNVIPARGQTVLVRNVAPAMMTAEDGDMYIMTRAAGGGTILGGCYQKNNWDPMPDPNLAQKIMKRAIEYCPELVKPGQGVEGLDIVRHNVGLRPLRIGGPRIEKEVINGVKVVHNYGAGSFGYQTSYGLAEFTRRLVEEFMTPKAKL